MVEPPHQKSPLSAVPAGMLDGVDLVVFDFDGVVVDSEVISLSTLKVTFDACGLAMSDEEVRKAFLGKSKASIFAFLSLTMPDVDHDEFSDFWETKLFARFRCELRAITGLETMLNHLVARGIPYCIASSGSSTRINVALEAVGLKHRFSHVFSADHVRRGKPAPDLFLHAAKTLETDPSRCLVIEDSPFGVQAAEAAQMRCIGFVGGAHLCDVRAAHEAELKSLGAETAVAAFDELIERS